MAACGGNGVRKLHVGEAHMELHLSAVQRLAGLSATQNAFLGEPRLETDRIRAIPCADCCAYRCVPPRGGGSA